MQAPSSEGAFLWQALKGNILKKHVFVICFSYYIKNDMKCFTFFAQSRMVFDSGLKISDP